MENTQRYKQLLLVIFDGWGYSEETKYNAIAQANPTFFNSLWKDYPHTLLKASGEALGLPEGQIGTSETAHTTIGAGSVIYTDIVRMNKMISDGYVGENPAIKNIFTHVKENNSTLHLLGMVSPGGVHSHQDHLFAIVKEAKAAGVTKIVIHAFTDGRDKPPRSANEYLKQLESLLDALGVGHVATITGRYYAMDRDTNWNRTEKAYDALFAGKGREFTGKKPSAIIEELYTNNESDEFFEPCILLNPEGKADVIQQNDGVFFFNFRHDRARQLSRKIADVDEKMNLCFTTLSEYDPTIKSNIVLPTLGIETTLSDEVEKAGLTQTHIAETEKYAHVTYFFDGGREKPLAHEAYVLINSRKDIATHDQAPEMKAKEIADKTVEAIEKGSNFVVINFANADMVGHCGNIEATIQAIQTLDVQLERVVSAIQKVGGVAVITADHGNAELQFDEEHNQKHTAHTLNPVPAIVTDKTVSLHEGALSDVAPTVLKLLNLPQPKEMSGKSLF
jgi:2,3-bisphosphoglycerate-independent phosphoglycerate mutase